ncbi:Mrr N-terminal domain-containing protein [Psychrobacillus sp. OK028]|uniref:winged helix-turn-helix domain-containing protein n=1 Tax=Psychrobacillus sp. OK028 TaxID=1884359 RepID=UPI00088B3962|nr:winged helix-turn-helix domain-containing protein [Psychrobacillus sp. OK028]SDN76689.1 Mrr N-terminal domain-containing protein [Psychrobacillus sp. OK028]
MAVPGYQDFMYPFLKQLENGNEYKLQELYVLLDNHFHLSDKDIVELLPSGKQTLLHNRIGWARTYLSKAGLSKVVSRAVFKITDNGLKVLADTSVTRIDTKFLSKYQSFNDFVKKIQLINL